MTADRPRLLDVIDAFFPGGREARPGQVYPGPRDRTEPAARAGRQSPALTGPDAIARASQPPSATSIHSRNEPADSRIGR